MRNIVELAGHEMLWVSSGKGLVFELRAGDEVIGSLRWERSSLARGETADQQWTFKREGIWHPYVTVRVAGSDANLGLFQPSRVAARSTCLLAASCAFARPASGVRSGNG